MNQQALDKIVNAAVEILVRRANIEITGSYQAKAVSGADIFAAIVDEPKGNVAFRLAELIALGINYYEAATA